MIRWIDAGAVFAGLVIVLALYVLFVE